jgi:hypothetical protein
VVCRALDGWTPEKANDFLLQAGTASDYAGLYRDVRAFRPPATEALARMPGDFPETAKTPPMVDTMVEVDTHTDALKAAQTTGWREVPGHGQATPAQTATLLWELFRELGRDPEIQKRGDDYAAKLAAAENFADALRKVLGDPRQATKSGDTAFQEVTKSCTACHKAHRN